MKLHLQHIYVERFGGLADCAVGPFGKGLNIVYGPNEAGKSTLAAFVGGVLFGWEEAHGVRNRYVPSDGGRAGSLVFSGDEATGQSEELARDELGARGLTPVLEDVDRATFDAVFSFSADELRSLRNSSDVTARLLTAASGTGASPAAAFVEVEASIASGTRRVLELVDALEEARDEMKQATDQAELYKQDDRELRDLRASRTAVAVRVEAANDDIEDLVTWRSDLETLDERLDELHSELDQVREEQLALCKLRETDVDQSSESAIDPRLLDLDSASERVLRDRIDEFAERQEKADRMLDTAKENSATSSAAYEALLELGDGAAQAGRARRTLSARFVIAALLPVLFVAAGVPLFMHGREIASLSFTALGLGLIASAIFLASAAVVALLRPSRGEAELEKRRRDAQWVMLQDRKKLDACRSDKQQLAEEIAAFFSTCGLQSANGSIRQARSLLDEAADRRADRAAIDQRLQAFNLRILDVEKRLKTAEEARRTIERDSGVDNASARELESLLRQRTAERDALVESANAMSERIGELVGELDQAKDDRTLSLVKARYSSIRAQLREAKDDLAELLLAKRMLDRSIASWENQNQPEVYEQASRLLSLVTGGVWVEVATSATGSLVAIGADGTVRDPRHLSLGTCQQLYLALRIALLLVARDVGRSIPVLADDVLVNFDAARRAGAAAALAELARSRQVIVFTCHRETLAALQSADPTATLLPLKK